MYSYLFGEGTGVVRAVQLVSFGKSAANIMHLNVMCISSRSGF